MVEWTPTLILLAILSAVPLQFYLSSRSSSDAKYYLHRLVEDVREIYGRYVSTAVRGGGGGERGGEVSEAESFRSPFVSDEVVDEGTLGDSSQAKRTDLFGGSDTPRDPRAPQIKFRVGQVIRHKLHGYKGVVIAWDEEAKAPEWWLARTHGERKDLAEQPNYTVLIDTRDRLIPQIGYIAEENIELGGDGDGAVVHPLVKHYFEYFDGSCYRSRPWHRRIYPND